MHFKNYSNSSEYNILLFLKTGSHPFYLVDYLLLVNDKIITNPHATLPFYLYHFPLYSF